MIKSVWYGFLLGQSAREKLQSAAEAGFEAVEPNGTASAEERAELKALLREFGLRPASVMTTTPRGGCGSSPEPEARAKAVEGGRAALETASELGTDTVLFVPGRVSPEISYETAARYARQTVSELLPEAERLGVSLAIENVWNKFLLSPIEFAAFIDGFGSDYVRAYFDVGNILLYGYPQHWIRSLGGRICRVHVKGFDTKTFGWTSLLAGSVDWPAVMSAFKDIGYSGFMTAELPPDERGLAGISADMSEIFKL